MGQKQAVRSNLRQSRRRQTGVSQVTQPNRSRRGALSLWLLFKLSLKLFHRHTSVLWLVVGALLIGTTAAAVMTIVDPTASVAPQSNPESMPLAEPTHTDALEPQPTREHPPSQSRPAQSASPLSAGSLLLLSCAGGCFLLSQCLRPQSQSTSKRSTSSKTKPRRSVQTKSSRVQPKTATSNQGPRISEIVVPNVHPVEVLQSPDGAEKALPTDPEPQPLPQASAEAEVTVTVVPDERSHPLDWDEPSLADNLDLRQQRPLSYWL